MMMIWQRRELGQGLVEYALIILFIALVVIAVLGVLGTHLSEVFSQVSAGFT
jgi:pilus assembly protein Flp/PilA